MPFTIIEENIGDEDSFKIKIKLNDGASANEVLQYLLPKTSVNLLQEVIPSMNEIFIEQVNLIR